MVARDPFVILGTELYILRLEWRFLDGGLATADRKKAVTGTSFTEANAPSPPKMKSDPKALRNEVPVTAFSTPSPGEPLGRTSHRQRLLNSAGPGEEIHVGPGLCRHFVSAQAGCSLRQAFERFPLVGVRREQLLEPAEGPLEVPGLQIE